MLRDDTQDALRRYLTHVAPVPCRYISRKSEQLADALSAPLPKPYDVVGMSVSLAGGATSMLWYLGMAAPAVAVAMIYDTLRE